MPIASVGRDRLFEVLGATFTDDEFQDLCFEYGIELDDVTTEKEMMRKEHNLSSEDTLSTADDEVLYKIDIPANRYDMLCLEGIARALNVFRGKIPNVDYSLANMVGKEMERMVVKPCTALVRPFVVCAILRGITFNQARYSSFMDLQEKLHQNLCRGRSLVAIGTHDLDTLQGPFSYEALDPEEIRFVPLKQSREFSAAELMDYYLENDNHLRKYVPIIKDSLVYPVIYDANRTVLSLPPIINGAHSSITLNTHNIFIECTATDLTKARIVLNTVCCMFSEYCETPFEVEPVEVVDAFQKRHVYPELQPRTFDVSLEYINQSVGVSLQAQEVAKLLGKMLYKTELLGMGENIRVEVPPTRSDVLHPCDVMEDVAIAYGYNNIERTIPRSATQGRELPINQLTELLRLECSLAAYMEILTWSLCSRAENFSYLRIADDGKTAVSVGNPKTAEFEVCRTSLLPGALKTLGANTKAPKPIKLFEVSDVVLVSEGEGSNAKNERHLIAVYCSTESGFEVIHGLLNRLMDALGVPVKGSDSQLEAKVGGGYEWTPMSSAAFFPGRQASVSFKGGQVGSFGVVHPEVLQKFNIDYPVSALELNIEPFCFDQFYKQLPTKLA